MIDLEFSKYDDPRDTIYGPYRCTCARGHKCQACTENLTMPPYTRAADRPATRNLAGRQADLRAFAARWFAETGELPLPSEMLAFGRRAPRPEWYVSISLIYYAYPGFEAWYDDCLMHGIGTEAAQQATRVRLAQRRHRPGPRRRQRQEA